MCSFVFWERGGRKQRCREGRERVGERIRKMKVKRWRRGVGRRVGFGFGFGFGFGLLGEVVGWMWWVRDGAVAVGEWEGGMMW